MSFGRIAVIVSVTSVATILAIMRLAPRPARQPGFEASAIGSLRAINSGEAAYSMVCARGGYAIDLADLAKEPPGGSGFISPDLAVNGALKNGYIFTLTKERAAGVTDVSSPAETCNGAAHQPASSYHASATPVAGSSARRHFATDRRGTIFQSNTPIPNPIPPTAVPAQ